MTTSPPWLLYGAYGYTGALVARAAAAQGVEFVLAGRRQAPLDKLAGELNLPARRFSLHDADAITRALGEVAGVLNCAGPFLETAEPLITACLAAGRHYLDIAGEIDVFERAHAHDGDARTAGVVLCPGVGFDVVSTDCLAAALKNALPTARYLALGFDAHQHASPGTARTMIAGLLAGGMIRKGKFLVRTPLGEETRDIDFGAGEKSAVALPWGDVATAFYSTGIGEVRVYVPASERAVRRLRRLDSMRPFLSLAPIRRSLSALAASRSRGPDGHELDTGRVHVWGEARTRDGLCVVGRMETPNGYAFTRDATLAAVRRLTREPPDRGGYYTPSLLFGSDFAESLPGVGKMEIA